MTWEDLIAYILEEFPAFSDVIFSDGDHYCVLSNGRTHKRPLPPDLKGAWPELMQLLFAGTPNGRV